jgi:hypothetical protein
MGVEILQDFEIDGAREEVVVFVDCEADGESAGVVVGYFVLFYWAPVCSACVVGQRGAGGDGVFYEGGAGYEGDVVEVYNLGFVLAFGFGGVAEGGKLLGV